MLNFSPIARLTFRGRLVLVSAALAVLGLRPASAGIEASPDFPLEQSKASSENPADRLLSMYRKDVGIVASAEKTSSKKPVARVAEVLAESK